ncbi:EamA family transporter [Bacillus carboniphilus]|uniref:EamA family transporter n=1 Tax=Bacillus carboniphilus TaxID=86663 RepID=A0ABY9JQJ5_9BACI|nr:EamA family transporter [Bacillus carboniphilus]WLR41677.1 EamA family transporter [Bacillus carboniphilus]
MLKSIKQSISKNKKGIILMIIASFLISIGQLLWKLSNGTISLELLLGLVLYGLGAVIMIIAFQYGSLSVLHPLLSLSYIFAILLGLWILDEKLLFVNYFGILLIIVGSILIGGGDVE